MEIGIVCCCVIFGVLFLLFLLLDMKDRFEDIGYVKAEINRAYGEREYRHWRKELHTLYWCLIPGLTPRRVESLRKLFYRGKYCKPKEKDPIFSMLMPSLLGIAVCSVCLAGSTFAWFTASQSTATQTLRAANYEVSARIQSGETELDAVNGNFSLEEGEYTVALTAGGDANTGYCVLNFDGTKVYTDQIPQGGAMTFTLKVDGVTTLKIAAVWGTYAGEVQITEGTVYELQPAG